MAYDTTTTVTDNITDNLSQYHNELKTAADHVMSASAYSAYSNVQSMTGNVTLSDTDFPIQSFAPTAARDLTLPAVASTNHAFFVMNTSGTYAITIKNAGATTIYTLLAGQAVMLFSDGVVWKPSGMTVNAGKLLGRYSTDSGAIEEVTVGSGLSLTTDGTLSASGGSGGDKYPMEFRMTLTSGTAVTTANVTGATTIYITPYQGNQIGLYSGSAWVTRTSAEFSLALGTITSGLPYDVFVYDNAGTPTAEKLAWTNGTTRATALTTQDGVLVKSGDATRRYIGTFYTTATTTTEDSDSKRFLWNAYNRVDRPLKALLTTNSWTYTTDVWRARDGNTTAGNGRVECVVGLAEDVTSAYSFGILTNGSAVAAEVGIGIDSTSANSAPVFGSFVAASTYANPSASYQGVLAVGYHYIQNLERSQAVGTTTWYGDAGADYLQAGMTALVKG